MTLSDYEYLARIRIRQWEKHLLRPPGFLERTTKSLQTKINEKIPEKVHRSLTSAIKGIFHTVLFGLDFMPKGKPQYGLTLRERDELARSALDKYKKIAAAEGAGTGAGGFALGLVDFPALIAIKMKCLFELAHIYGFPVSDYRERLFLLCIFQLAFSSREHKEAILQKIRNWNVEAAQLPPGEKALQAIDWQKLQQEYRDAIDFRKMLQLVPGIGAIVGAWANFSLLEELGETAMNAYGIRLLD